MRQNEQYLLFLNKILFLREYPPIDELLYMSCFARNSCILFRGRRLETSPKVNALAASPTILIDENGTHFCPSHEFKGSDTAF